jgi:hypothetical protein
MDLRTTRAVRAELPPDLEWVDHAARGPVDAIETPVAQKEDLLYQLYWNTSIRRELLLGNAVATDAFNAPHLQIRSDGSLANAPGEVLFHDFGTTGRLMSAQRIASHYWFTLWRPTGRARLRLVVQGRFYDGWLNPIGRLRAWARRPGTGLTVSFRLSLPPKADRVVRVAVGGGSFTVRPRRPVRVRCSTTRDRLDVGYSAVGLRVLPNDFRSVTVRMLALAVADGGKQTSPTCGRE